MTKLRLPQFKLYKQLNLGRLYYLETTLIAGGFTVNLPDTVSETLMMMSEILHNVGNSCARLGERLREQNFTI